MFRDLILPVMGAVWGIATSAGVFALLIKLGVVPRMIAVCHLAKHVLACENAIMLGTIAGCVFSLGAPGSSLWDFFGENAGYLAQMAPAMTVSGILLAALGLGAGIFVGCQAMALAEILNMFPILFRRLKLQMGLAAMVTALALGKLAGSLWYFIFSYQNG
jgi:stage V sporulation protein AB